MAPKKRDRERAGSVNDNPADDKKNKKEDKTEIEQSELLKQVPVPFLRSAQLYRMCAVRQATAPLFLQRSLTYLRHRMSRSHERRKTFKVDSILPNKKDSQPEKPSKHLTITYLGYYDVSLPSGERSTVRVETSIMKRCFNRRKDASAPLLKLSMGTSEVPVNPQEDDDRPVPIISITPETINVNNGPVKARSLVIRVLRDSAKDGKEEPFEVTYQLYGSRGQCLLEDACYEAGPGMQDGLWLRLQGAAKEAIADSNVKAPKISFKLEWTLDAKSGWVQRPTAPSNAAATAAAMAAECHGDNKENRPAKRGSTPVTRGSRPTRAAAAPAALVAAEAEADGPSASAAMPASENPVTISYNFQYHTGHLNTPFDNRPFTCPWCDLNCMNMYSLFKHLKVCHDRYTFNFTMTDNHVRVDVSLNELPDTSYEGNPYNLVNVRRNADMVSRRTVFTKVQVCHPRRPRPSLAEFFEAEDGADTEVQRPLITGHDRLYYHTTTCLPVHPREIDQDSEGEKDPKWLQQKTIMMIDDFTDVNEGEKEVIKMWNLHVLKHGYVGDCQVPLACTMFVKEKGEELLRKNLYRNFVLHLCNLFDFGLLSPPQVYTILAELREILRADVELVDIARNAWKEQLRSWLASGGAGGPRDKAAQDFPSYDNQPGPSNNPKQTASSTFITGDGTLRRKMTQQGTKKCSKPASAAGSSSQKAMDEDEEEPMELGVDEPGPSDSAERALRKRKLSLQERPGEEPAKRPRCGSDPLEAGKPDKEGHQPLRRKSTPPSDESKQPLRKSTLTSEESKPPLRKSTLASEESKPPLRKSTVASEESKPPLRKSTVASEESKPPLRKSTLTSEEPKPPLRKSTVASEESKPPLRKSTAPSSDESKPPLRKSVAP